MKKKILLGAAAACLLGVAGYVVLGPRPDGTAMINMLVMSHVETKDFAQARQIVDVEYKKKQDLPELWRFWDGYVTSCEQGACPDVVQDTGHSGYGEQAAYAVARQETAMRFKAPLTRIEEKSGLKDKGAVGERYTFTLDVAGPPSLGCVAEVWNVGEHTWFMAKLECARR